MSLTFPLESVPTGRPLALAHQCGCASCGTTSPCGPRSLRVSTSQPGPGRAIRALATGTPNGTSAAPSLWFPGSGHSASQGGQPYIGAIMQSLGTDPDYATAARRVASPDPRASVFKHRLVRLFATPARQGAGSDLNLTAAPPLLLEAGFLSNTAQTARCSSRPPASHPTGAPPCAPAPWGRRGQG